MPSKYRVVWTLEDGRKMASEYAGQAEAEFHYRDIAGWMPDAHLEEIRDGSEPRPGPFEIHSPKTWHERLA